MKKGDNRVRYWLSEIEAAKRREKDWRADGKAIMAIYSGERVEETPFNILFSNTETMFPALYSSVPRPVVDRRFKDDDPVGKMAADAGRRTLEFLLDTNVEGYETFDQGMRSAVLDALLPGRGVTAVKYDAEVSELKADDESLEPEGEEEAEPQEYKKSELVCLDSKYWNRTYFGYAKKWSNVPWVAYEENIDKAEATRLFGEDMASRLVYTKGEESEEDQRKQDEDQGERKTALVYQIWDKDTRTIKFIAESYKDGYLKEIEDPLGLTGFFNIPKPLQFMEKSNDLTPTALYKLYENQAKELNSLTVRINKICHAIKARGIYDAELGTDIKNLMDASDNELVPADKSSSLAAEKGLQNAIWFMPLETLVITLRELNLAREACKQVIYEIMGIADIMRGASNASETLGAQQIKQNWGNLRLKRVQKEVQRYARDLLRMMLEVAATKFSVETWRKMTGLPYPTAEEKAMAQQALSQWQASQPPPMQGQPPPQPDPQMVQMAQSPSWEEILAILNDDLQRAYRIDIETNSTVEPEAAEDQKNIQELMGALGQFLNGVGPLVEKGVLPFQAAQTMMLAISRRYRFGPEIEDQIKAMKEPQKPDPAAAEKEKQAAEVKKHEMTLAQQAQVEQQKAKEREAQIQADSKREQAQAQAEAAKEVEKIRQDAMLEAKRLEEETRKAQLEANTQKAIAQAKAAIDSKTELEKARIAMTGQIITAIITASKGEEGGGGMSPEEVMNLISAQDGIASALVNKGPELKNKVSGMEATIQSYEQMIRQLQEKIAQREAEDGAEVEFINGPDGEIESVRKGSKVIRVVRGRVH